MESAFDHKTLDQATRLLLSELRSGLESIGLSPRVAKRGYFGNVWRFHFDDRVWFDLLPAKSWVTFYFSPAASRLAQLQFSRLSQLFLSAVQRRDMIVKIKVNNADEAGRLVDLVRAALRP